MEDGSGVVVAGEVSIAVGEGFSCARVVLATETNEFIEIKSELTILINRNLFIVSIWLPLHVWMITFSD